MGQLFGKPAPKDLSLSDHRKTASTLTAPSGFPLPDTVHLRVSSAQLPAGNLIIVGDVHGCYDELLCLLQKCNYEQGRDTLLLVGDLVNKGPKSLEVLDFIQQANAYVVRGNHDDAALKAFRALQKGEKVKAKFQWVADAQPHHISYLAALPFSLCIPELRLLVVHAGLIPGVDVEQQDLRDLFTMRDLSTVKAEHNGVSASTSVEDGNGVEAPGHGLWTPSEEILGEGQGQPWASVWNGPYHVFFGHDAKRGLQNWPYATGLDSGCVYGKQLTACVLTLSASVADAVTQLPAHEAPTLQVLGAAIVSVQAQRVYEDKKKKKNKGFSSDVPE